MLGLGFLVLLLLLLPFGVRAVTRSRSREKFTGIKWPEPDYATRAVDRQRAGDLAGALADYDKALEKERTAEVLNNRGCALLEAGEVDRATADLTEAVTLEPGNATAQCSLAEALVRGGKLDEATAALAKAIEVDPKWKDFAREAAAFAPLRDTEAGKALLGM